MDLLRKGFDFFYSSIKPFIFYSTKKDPEKAHQLFSTFCSILYKTRLDNIILNNKSNEKKLPFDLSNAAGFNKNAEIPTRILKYLGFDRVVIGTFTYQPYPGNPRPRVIRYPEKESLVNNTGLPNEGAENIVKRILNYKKHEIPLTASIASTPNKKNIDLDKTIDILNEVPYIDRIELDISCPNIKSDYSLEELLDT